VTPGDRGIGSLLLAAVAFSYLTSGLVFAGLAVALRNQGGALGERLTDPREGMDPRGRQGSMEGLLPGGDADAAGGSGD
jgi:hypothetical protein